VKSNLTQSIHHRNQILFTEISAIPFVGSRFHNLACSC